MPGVDLAKLRAAQEAAAAAGSQKAQQALAAQANGGNALGGSVTLQNPVIPNQTGGSMTTYSPPAATPAPVASGAPAVSMAPTTNYVQQGTSVTGSSGAGKTLNDILYAKDQYDAGNKQWASSTAQGLYSQLDPALARQVQGMSAAQLRQYLAGQSTQPGPSAPAATPSAPSVGAAFYPSGGSPANGSAAPAQPGYQSTYTGPDLTGMTNQLNTLYDNRLSAETQKLRDALATALQGYNAQETQARQSAYDNRNAADVAAMQGQQGMNEVMANMGLTGDGQNLTLAAAQAASRQGALTDINRAETNALQNISEQRANLQNNAAQNELALAQSVGADKAAALYDLLKYGDTRAFEVDQSNYGRYRDDINQQFAEDQFGWQKLMQEAGLTGVYNGQSTMAGKQQNLDAALAYSQLTGQVLSPQSDWSGLVRQASSGSAPLSLAGQQAQLQRQQANFGAAIDVAGLTGAIVNPQADWSGLFRQAAAGGNGPTMAALQQAMAQQNYSRGVYESDRSYELQANSQSQQNSNSSFGRLVDIWKLTGQAPAGLESYGVQAGMPYSDGAANKIRTIDPNEIKSLAQSFQYAGQDPGGKSYRYTPPKTNQDARYNVWVDTVTSMRSQGYDDGSIAQVLRYMGITGEEETSFLKRNGNGGGNYTTPAQPSAGK
ncbi:hypothetical protein HGI30_15865 [Paenibacillus albicereus]|uniref:Uncharacterized protein n=1 Tax=Paenibacillus albicereus TaxID=2726185 RepID=A0A6H2H0F2_9BACL|nr:hypothetical protein [Paenibacillus albicereus]QJC52896.1 hypothetical protein HGI30_15865 [Paenibacillus albicereus]